VDESPLADGPWLEQAVTVVSAASAANAVIRALPVFLGSME
jgi:hypothetical protein